MYKAGVPSFGFPLPGRRRPAWLPLLIALAACCSFFPRLALGAPTILYAFSGLTNSLPVLTNVDGAAPAARMALDNDGNLYGTTPRGGTNGAGSIFRIGTNGGLVSLYSFLPATNALGEVDYDLGPNDLVFGGSDVLYGTTRYGGSNFTGTIFEVSTSGTFTLLHTFAAGGTNSVGEPTSSEGAVPVGALVLAGDGNYYGATQYGGSNGTGTIFQLTPTGGFANLYSFASVAAGVSGTNGAQPNGLTLGSDGYLYGTTQKGGLANGGTFFKISTQGVFTQIYSFDGNLPLNNPVTPNSPLTQGTNGNFYGTSSYGGSQFGGTVFEVTNTGGATVVHSFPLAAAGALGSALTFGLGTNNGVLYGTTPAEGLNGEGAVFRIDPTGDFSAYYFSPLNSNFDNAVGVNPSAALTEDALGNLYGTCAAGGTNGSGEVFQLFGPAFFPPSFFPILNWPPRQTNVLVGASVNFSYPAEGISPLTYQWLLNGTNLTDGGDISGSSTGGITISPVNYRDIGSYQLVLSNTWGALTSAVTVLTITPPGVSITSPKPNASITSGVFSGTATNAPLFPGANPSTVQLTAVLWSITNQLTGSNISGTATLSPGTGGVSNWTFTATPLPGTNILSVQSEDASGNISPPVSETFFYETLARLTVLTTGSGAVNYNITNGSMLLLGASYTIVAKPISSTFSNWLSAAPALVEVTNDTTNYFTNELVFATNFSPALEFVMQSNLVLTADVMAKRPPSITITSPKAKARTNAPVLEGTAAASPVFANVNPTNVQLTSIVFWMTNVLGTNITVITNGIATFTNGGSVSNWSILVTNLPGTNTLAVQTTSGFSPLLPGLNILAVQAQDISGAVSKVESRSFFYLVPSLFTVTNAGNGIGTLTGKATVAGDAPPTNGAMLYIGDTYKITAKAGQNSFFTNWFNSATNGFDQDATYEFYMQSNLVLTATFLQIPPLVTITSPKPKLRTPAPVFNGTATGRFAISNVSWALSGPSGGSYTNGLATLSAGAGLTANWSISVVPAPGSNTLAVFCIDTNGNQSATVTNGFFYQVPALFTVTNTGSGDGTFKGSSSVAGGAVPANGAMLYLGQGYKITAVPGKGSLFASWADSAGDSSGSPALSFIMQTNLVATATFVTNFFPPLAGTYNGLFYDTNKGISPQSAGMLDNLVLRDTGAISGKFLTTITNYPFAASFNAAGQANFKAGTNSVSLTLNTESLQITGTVGTAALLADLASNVLPSSEYTVLLAPTNAPISTLPPGDGYALVSLHNGVVTLSGSVADGTTYNETVPVSRDGFVPVYASLYKATNTERGLLLGWINLTNLQSPSNNLTWIKQKISPPPNALYTNGFTESLFVQGAPWTNPPAGTPAIDLASGQLTISNTTLFLDYSNVMLTDNDKLTATVSQPTNSLTGSVNPKTGLLTVTFANGNRKSPFTYTGYGVVLQDSTNAGGYFITTNIGGAIHLQP